MACFAGVAGRATNRMRRGGGAVTEGGLGPIAGTVPPPPAPRTGVCVRCGPGTLGGFLEGRTTFVPGRHVTDRQTGLFRKLRQTHPIEAAAAKADISPATGYRITQDPRLPSQKAQPRERCRPDPLESIFDAEVVPLPNEAPGHRPAAVFEGMLHRPPELRSAIRRILERRIRSWCARRGAERDVIFRQVHEPGGMGLSDFDDLSGPGVTIGGQPLAHRLFHFRLPWSGFEHAPVIPGGESHIALA